MIKINDKTYRELRCSSCRKLIGYEYIFAGRFAFVCSRCGETSTYTFKHIRGGVNDAIIDNEFILKSNRKEVNKK